MIKVACVLVLAVAAHCFYIDDGSEKSAKDKIVGGMEIAIENAPYLAQIIQNRRQICGGTIISEEWIVTAAHCVEYTYKLAIVTGSSYRGEGQRHKIAKIIIHKDYDNETYNNDIALIKLAGKIEFNDKQQPITIAANIPKTDDKVKISGFGRVGEGLPASHRLKSAIVRVMSRDECEKRYTEDDESISENMFCAGTGETDSCSGDSGGPAIINGQLSGVVSAGRECASVLYPGVYTQVYGYRQWIASKTQLDLSITV